MSREDDELDRDIYHAWRESEAYAVPMTEQGEQLAKHRWYGFKAGWEACKQHLKGNDE